MSRVIGDQIECGYHGFTFDSAGQCVRIPAQSHVPAGFRTRHYPTVERWKWIWIWAGSAQDADPSLIPDHEEAGLEGGDWLAEVGCDFSVQARYQLFNENLLDLTHLTFLHSGTIGTPGIATAKITTEVDGRVVRVKRDTLDEDATPFYAARLGISVSKIDRRHVTTFTAPSFHVIHVTTTEAASAADGRAPAVYGEHKIVHAITPETQTTMRDFWAFTRTYNRSAEASDYLRKNLSEVIRQDIVALEAVESLIGSGERRVELSCAADEASLKGRQVVQGLLREQRLS